MFRVVCCCKCGLSESLPTVKKKKKEREEEREEDGREDKGEEDKEN